MSLLRHVVRAGAAARALLQLPRSRAKRMGLLLLAGGFVAAGANHFLRPDAYVRIVPPYLPAPRLLVYLSGAFEVLGGLGVLPRRTRSAAGWGLVLLLVAVFPANLHMALHAERFAPIPAWALYARLPLQLALIVWAYGCTRPDER